MRCNVSGQAAVEIHDFCRVLQFGDSKSFLAGTPPPALNHPLAGQHGHMGNFAHTGHPFMPMIPPAQQPPHHPSLFHQQQHHHMTHQHLDAGQGGTTQRGQQVSGLKQSQNKGHQGSAGYPPFWPGQNWFPESVVVLGLFMLGLSFVFTARLWYLLSCRLSLLSWV